MPLLVPGLLILPVAAVLLHLQFADVSIVQLINLLKLIESFEDFFLLGLVIGGRVLGDHEGILNALFTIC